MGNQEIEKRLMETVDANKEKVLAIAQHLYENPEIALQEVESAKYLCEFLRKEGFEVEEHYLDMPTAFKATKKNGDGPRIAFMAEYDALPGNGHACGHHMIAAMSVGAGMALASLLDTFKGEVTIFGTPAEETGEGKPFMVEKGAFDGYQAAMEVHPNSATCVDPDIISIGGIDFTFTGQAAHAGAMPYNGVNALDAVVLFFNNINALRQQLVDGTRVHGIIQEAGSAANIIPDKGRVRLEMRAKEQPYFEKLVERIVNCAKGAALATGCELEYHHFEPTCQGLKTNQKLAAMWRENMKKFPAFVEGTDKFSGGASDVGNVSQVIPVIHPMMQFVEHGEGVHTQDFLKASILPYAKDRAIECIKLLALTGMQLLEDQELSYHLD